MKIFLERPLALFFGIILVYTPNMFFEVGADASSATDRIEVIKDIGNQLSDVVVNPSSGKLYVSDIALGTLMAINSTNNQLLKEIDIWPSSSHLAVNPVTNKIYAGTGRGIWVIDGRSDSAVTRILNDTSFEYGAVNPLTNKIYFETVGGSIVVIDGNNNNSLVKVNPLPINGLGKMAIDPIAKRLYVVEESLSSVGVIDTSSDTLIGTVNDGAIEVAKGIGSIDVDPSTHTLYEERGPDSVIAIDEASLKQIANTTLASYTGYIAANSLNNVVYVYCDTYGRVNYKSSDVPPGHYLYAINGSNNVVIQKMRLPDVLAPVSMTIDPISDTVYFANQSGSPGTVIAVYHPAIVESTPEFGSPTFTIALSSLVVSVFIITAKWKNRFQFVRRSCEGGWAKVNVSFVFFL